MWSCCEKRVYTDREALACPVRPVGFTAKLSGEGGTMVHTYVYIVAEGVLRPWSMTSGSRNDQGTPLDSLGHSGLTRKTLSLAQPFPVLFTRHATPSAPPSQPELVSVFFRPKIGSHRTPIKNPRPGHATRYRPLFHHGLARQLHLLVADGTVDPVCLQRPPDLYVDAAVA